MKIRRLIMLFMTAMGFSFVSGAVVAHLLGDRDRSVSIQNALRNPNDPQMVEVVGDLQQIGRNRFILRDKTGMVVLETCPPWYCKISPIDLVSVRVKGIVTTERTLSGSKRTYMDVYRFKWHNGTETVIRPSLGKPPWAFRASQPFQIPSNQ